MHVDEEGKTFFVTSNFSLCGYLELKGLKFVKANLSQGKNNKIKVDFYFLDSEKKAQDLEIEFRHSDEKKYKDSLFFYRKIINDLLGT
jgi:hypothetical protein